MVQNGDCQVAIAYIDHMVDDKYVGVVATPDHSWFFDDLRPPRFLPAGSALMQGYDSDGALAEMARPAASFADHFTSGRGGESAPERWNEHGDHFASACHGEFNEAAQELVFAVVGPVAS